MHEVGIEAVVIRVHVQYKYLAIETITSINGKNGKGGEIDEIYCHCEMKVRYLPPHAG